MNPSTVTEPRTLLTLICRELVDDPSAVRVQALEGRQALVLEVRCDRADVRRLIGKRGRTADAIRELLTNVGGKLHRRISLELIEPDLAETLPLPPDDLPVELGGDDVSEKGRRLLEALTWALVDEPSLAHVAASVGTSATLLRINAAPADISRVIGRSGRTAGALREVLQCLSGRYRHRFILEIAEPNHVAHLVPQSVAIREM